MVKLKQLGSAIADLWRSSALIQGTLALMFGATICFMAIDRRPIPEILTGILGLIMGFYFGTKNRITT